MTVPIPLPRPAVRPRRPFFSSGPCVKPPGWRLSDLSQALVGRYHRSTQANLRLSELFGWMREILQIPATYCLYLSPGSDTGAFEAALWNLLGLRSVDVLAWDRFGRDWLADAIQLLGPERVRALEAPDGELPDLDRVNLDHDIVFPWTGTSTGVAVPDADWIADSRSGLTFCDATSAVLTLDLPWKKLDVTTFSWQKAMGGEAQHGILILSPRAVERLRSAHPAWPVPKLFHLDLPEGECRDMGPVNTPSLLCIEDALLALKWIHSVGGLSEMIARSRANFALIDAWVDSTCWVDHLAAQPHHRGLTPVCLRVTGDAALTVSRMVGILAEEKIAYDITHYRHAPVGLRIWTGPNIDHQDLESLLPWLEWAYQKATLV